MQAAINNSLIKTVEAKEKPFEIRDTVLKGLLLRVQPSGAKTYYAEYGRGKRVKLGRADAITPIQARERAKEVFADAFKGDEPEAVKRRKKSYTLEQYLDEVYLPWANTHLRAAKNTELILRHSFASLMTCSISELTSWQMEKWKNQRAKDNVKKSTINREMNALRACLNKAVAWGNLLANPMDGLKRYKEDDSEEIVRFLSNDEEKRLRKQLGAREQRIRKARESGNKWRQERGYELQNEYVNSAFVDHVMPMVIISLNTGLRRGELFKLEWQDVDLERGNLTVRGVNAKSKKARHVPLNDEALNALKDWKAQTEDVKGLVFKGKNGGLFDNINTAWGKLLDDAEITEFRWHDMRHHFASRLVMSGVDLNTVRELLGHSDYKMTLRYAHLAPEAKKAGVQRLVSHGQVIDLPEKIEEIVGS